VAVFSVAVSVAAVVSVGVAVAVSGVLCAAQWPRLARSKIGLPAGMDMGIFSSVSHIIIVSALEWCSCQHP
jgi:hypothetical protein